MRLQLVFDRDKATTNMVRFKERVSAAETPAVGTLYVHKTIAGQAAVLNVTIEEA
jgi:hypothetical protein